MSDIPLRLKNEEEILEMMLENITELKNMRDKLMDHPDALHTRVSIDNLISLKLERYLELRQRLFGGQS